MFKKQAKEIWSGIEDKSTVGWAVKIKDNGFEYLVDENGNTMLQAVQIIGSMADGYVSFLNLAYNYCNSRYFTRNYLAPKDHPLRATEMLEGKYWRIIAKSFKSIIIEHDLSILNNIELTSNNKLLNALQYECEFRAEKLKDTNPEEAEYYRQAARKLADRGTMEAERFM